MSDLKVRRAALKKLEDKYGRVTAERLVQAASDKRHPMHRDFMWDNAKAGHKYRIEQARSIISNINMITTDVSKPICTSYVRDPNAPQNMQGYISVASLRTEREAAHEFLMNEAAQLEARLDRMRGLADALDLVDELDTIISSVMVLSSRLRSRPAKSGRSPPHIAPPPA